MPKTRRIKRLKSDIPPLPSDDLFLRILHNDVVMSNFILPSLDWYDISSLFLSSPFLEEVFRIRNYWRTLFKRGLENRDGLNVVFTLTTIDAEKIKDSDDAQLFHRVGRTFALNLQKWKKLFLESSLPRGNIYALRKDSLVLDEDDEAGLTPEDRGRRTEAVPWPWSSQCKWTFTIDESRRFIIGHKLMAEGGDSPAWPTIFVWKVEEDGTVTSRGSFTLQSHWATSELRFVDPLWYFSMGDHLMSIYETNDLHVRWMPVWDWRRGVQVTAYEDVTGGEFEEFFRFSKLCAKRGYIATGNGLSVRVWQTCDGWKSVTQKFPAIETHCMDLDFDVEFLVTVGVCRKGGFLVNRNPLVLRVWSMCDGTKMHQISTSRPNFILFDAKLIFPAYGKDAEAERWRFVDLKRDEALPTGDGSTAAATSLQSPPPQIVLPEFDDFVSRQLRQVSVSFGVNHGRVGDKFLTCFTPGGYATHRNGARPWMPAIDVWDAKTLLEKKCWKESEDVTENAPESETSGSLLNIPCGLRSRRLNEPRFSSCKASLANIHDISFDRHRVIVCFGDCVEIVSLL